MAATPRAFATVARPAGAPDSEGASSGISIRSTTTARSCSQRCRDQAPTILKVQSVLSEAYVLGYLTDLGLSCTKKQATDEMIFGLQFVTPIIKDTHVLSFNHHLQSRASDMYTSFNSAAIVIH